MGVHPGRILHSDEHLLIVNKLATELTVAADGRGKAPLIDFLRKQYPGLRAVHRLDFGTSGAVVFARTAVAAEKIRDSKFGGWKKCYRALVAGSIAGPDGEIRAPLPARTHEGLVEALTRYRVLARFRDVTFVEVCIDTGRKHQIRRHFAGIGHPLLLDPLYGDRKADRAFTKRYGFRHFFLHAGLLDLPHPVTGEPLSIRCPLPAVFEEALQRLRGRGASAR